MGFKRLFGLPSRQLANPPWSYLATDWGVPGDCGGPDASTPCDPPTLVDFRAHFPEFASQPDSRVQTQLNEASRWGDQTWISCDDYRTAILYLTAHRLSLLLRAAAELPESDETGEIVVEGGDLTSVSFSDMRVSFAPPKTAGGSGEGAETMYDLSSTQYGQFYLDLLKVNQPAAMII